MDHVMLVSLVWVERLGMGMVTQVEDPALCAPVSLLVCPVAEYSALWYFGAVVNVEFYVFVIVLLLSVPTWLSWSCFGDECFPFWCHPLPL